MKTVRKIKITVIDDNRNEIYKFLRNENREQNKALNFCINHLFFSHIAAEKVKLLDNAYIEKVKEIEELIKKDYEKIKKIENSDKKQDKQLKEVKTKLGKHKKSLEKIRKEKTKQAREIYEKAVGRNISNSMRDLITENFTLHSDTKDRLTMIAKDDFFNDLSDVLQGNKTIRNYKKDNPLYIRGRSLSFYKNEKDYFIKFIKGSTFKCLLSTKRQNTKELESTLDKIINNEIKVCDSSIQLKDKETILNLTIEIANESKHKKVDGRVVGVDLGLKIPAYVSINDKSYIRKGIGTIKDFLRVRTQIQKRRKILQRNLKMVKGGNGRDKKIKALDRMKQKEKNFATTYNHMLSRAIVDFAIDNQANQINLELLRMSDTNKHRLLANWSYFQLQKMIEYKASLVDIDVKYVDPYHTSQICSICGHYEEGQREKQEDFICKNKFCTNYDKKVNADYNASQNIAKSIKYINEKEESEYYKATN